jgi:hypothetical protein
MTRLSSVERLSSFDSEAAALFNVKIAAREDPARKVAGMRIPPKKPMVVLVLQQP